MLASKELFYFNFTDSSFISGLSAVVQNKSPRMRSCKLQTVNDVHHSDASGNKYSVPSHFPDCMSSYKSAAALLPNSPPGSMRGAKIKRKRQSRASSSSG